MMETILSAVGMGFPVDLLLKATLVLAIAGAATVMMSRASAATRHLVWAVGIGGLLLLPLLALTGPRWEVPLVRESIPDGPAAQFAAQSNESLESGSAGQDIVRQPVPITGWPAAGSSSAAAEGSAGISGAQEPLTGPGRDQPWRSIALTAWAAGFLLLLLRVALGWWGTKRLSRNAEPVAEGDWLQLLKDAAWLLDVDREVKLLRSPSANTPMTWGTRRPFILIPAGADEWPEERRRVVLLHEMAHIARRDCLTQTIAEITCALYWFHPLAWVASRQLRIERERACDDRVLSAGEPAADYAGHLLEVARTYRGRQLYQAAAIGMARPSQLEGRLLAVLDSARRRTAPGRREMFVVAGIAALVLVPLAAVKAVEAKTHAEATGEPTLLQQIRATIDQSTTGLRNGSGASGIVEDPSERPAMLADSAVDLTVAARPGGTVTVDMEAGGDLTIVGWANDFVELHAELRGPSAPEMRVELTERNGAVRLFAQHTGPRRNRNGSHIFELRVPASSNLRIENGGGDVAIENVAGSFSGGTGGGDITLVRLAGDADLRTGGGNVGVSDSRLHGAVHTGGGNVTIVNNSGDLRGTTGGGNVRLQNSGPERIHTGGGNIELNDLPAGADLSTGGGDITVRSADGPLVARTGGGDIRVDRASSTVDVETGGGDIVIAAAGGSTSARTGSGDIHVAVTSARGAREVDLETGSGDVMLEVPADFAGSFEIIIEAARPDAHQIRSDIPLSTSGGNPGGTLRATGTTGRGGSRVIIHASSGDVTIRRAGSGSSAAATYTLPADASGQSMHDRSDAVDEAFSEAFGKDFETSIEALVSNSVGTFASGLAQFTVDVTASALEEAVAAIERAERDGSLSVSARRDLDELKEELADVRTGAR